MENGREIETVYVKNDKGQFEEYCPIETYAEDHGMSRQAVYFKARYTNMPNHLQCVRIKKLYLIKIDQTLELKE